MDRRLATAGGTVRTNLKSWGTSRGVRIPKRLCEWLGIGIGSELAMRPGTDEEGAYLMIRPSATQHRTYGDVSPISMDEAFAGYSGDYIPCEADWGDDAGSEAVL